MNNYYPIEVLIKKNLKTVVDGIKDVNNKGSRYTENPGIITMREVKYARERLSLIIEEATGKIYDEWKSKYRDIINEQELHSLTQQIMVNLFEQMK